MGHWYSAIVQVYVVLATFTLYVDVASQSPQAPAIYLVSQELTSNDLALLNVLNPIA